MTEAKQLYLNLGAWQERSVVNGPGERFVLWLQGCPIRCKGCFNQEFLPFERRRVLEVEQIARMVLAVSGVDGITYSGGEPIVQARGLALLSERLKARGLTIVCYTGYNLAELRQGNYQWVTRLLSHVDVLVDGPYVHERAERLLWRGSRNQRVHFLGNAYRHLAGDVDRRPAEVEFAIGHQGFTTTGLWPPGFLERLAEVLKR